MAAWAAGCDDLVCSSEVGVLKIDPIAFFGPYLRASGLGFAEALLIDDRTDNCAAFTAAGGAALRWTMHADPLADVARTLHAWLDAPPGAWAPPPPVAPVTLPRVMGASVGVPVGAAGRV
jgi:FMN phosphatase YigB (HAD superfamily)